MSEQAQSVPERYDDWFDSLPLQGKVRQVDALLRWFVALPVPPVWTALEEESIDDEPMACPPVRTIIAMEGQLFYD